MNDGIDEKSEHSLTASKDFNQKLAFALSRLHDGDYRFAVKVLRSLSKIGFANAQYILGRMYEDGIGVLRNTKKAFRLYEQAASKNHTYAQLAIAHMFLYGFHVEKDFNNVVKWSFYALNSGSPIAIYNLGMLYYLGIGVKKDTTRAIEYIKTSSEFYQKARYALQRLHPPGILIYYGQIEDEYYDWCDKNNLTKPLDIIDKDFYRIFQKDNIETDPYLSSYEVVVKMIDTEFYRTNRYLTYNDEHRKGLTLLAYPAILISVYVLIFTPITAIGILTMGWILLSSMTVWFLSKKIAYEEIESVCRRKLSFSELLGSIWFWTIFAHALLSVFLIIVSIVT